MSIASYCDGFDFELDAGQSELIALGPIFEKMQQDKFIFSGAVPPEMLLRCKPMTIGSKDVTYSLDVKAGRYVPAFMVMISSASKMQVALGDDQVSARTCANMGLDVVRQARELQARLVHDEMKEHEVYVLLTRLEDTYSGNLAHLLNDADQDVIDSIKAFPDETETAAIQTRISEFMVTVRLVL